MARKKVDDDQSPTTPVSTTISKSSAVKSKKETKGQTKLTAMKAQSDKSDSEKKRKSDSEKKAQSEKSDDDKKSDCAPLVDPAEPSAKKQKPLDKKSDSAPVVEPSAKKEKPLMKRPAAAQKRPAAAADSTGAESEAGGDLKGMDSSSSETSPTRMDKPEKPVEAEPPKEKSEVKKEPTSIKPEAKNATGGAQEGVVVALPEACGGGAEGEEEERRRWIKEEEEDDGEARELSYLQPRRRKLRRLIGSSPRTRPRRYLMPRPR